MYPSKINDSGFTLLEVMTSMVIMTVSLLLLLHLAMVALDGNKWASGTTSSTQLIQQKLEELRNLPEPVSGVDTANGIIREWRVKKVDSHLRQVAIEATWLTPDSITQTYTINTLIKTDAL